MRVDLHIHTTSSDGTWNVDKLLTKIREHQIGMFAITDHDALESALLMAQTLDGSDIKYVPGVEIACTYLGKEYHITTYGFDPQNQALLDLLAANQLVRRASDEHLMKTLEQQRPEVSFADYQAYQRDPRRGGWKSLNFLLDLGVVANIADYFRLLPTLDFAMIFSDPIPVIQTIKNAGGVAFLAHPSVHLHGAKMSEEMLHTWMEFGISGVECYSTYCDMEDAEEYAKFCRQHNLLISGGSDCHGDFIPSRKLGTPEITLDMLNLGFV